MKLIGIAALYLVSLACSAAYFVSESNNPYKKAEIYFVDWAFQPRYNLKAEDIREDPHLVMKLNNQLYIDNLISWLDIQLLEPVNEIDDFYIGEISKKEEVKKMISSVKNFSDLINVRLVIDLFKTDKDKETYVSDGYWLYSSDGSKAREIEEEFKENFSSFWRQGR